jgi:hypothetical protein
MAAPFAGTFSPEVVEVVLTGVLVLAALALACILASLSIAGGLARRYEQRMRHAHSHQRTSIRRYRGAHEQSSVAFRHADRR